MKLIIITCFMLNSFLAFAMNESLERRRSSLMVRHKRQSSLGDKVLISLNLKSDEEKKDSSNVTAALVTERRIPEESIRHDSPHRRITKSDSRNLISRAGENNRNLFIKSLWSVFKSIEKIKAVDDNDGIKEVWQNITQTRIFCGNLYSLEVTNYPPWVELLVDEEMMHAYRKLDNKMASLADQKS